MKQFFDFLSHRCRVLESTDKQSGAVAKVINLRLHSNAKQKVSCNSVIKAKCEYCRGAYFIYQCPQFLTLSIPNRIAEARKLCLNCLRSTDHVSSKCPSGVCRTCSRKHNTLLHLQQASSDQSKSSNSERAATGSSESAPLDSVAVHASNVTEGKCALLLTAVVFAQANDGSRKPCCILLDSGSQVNLISREFFNTLKLSPHSVNLSISGVNGTVTYSSQSVRVSLYSRLNSYSIVVDCVVIDRVTDNISACTKRKSVFLLSRISLADPEFHVSSKIDILVRAEIFWDLICVGQIKASLNHPILQKTRFAWIMAGRLNTCGARNQGALILYVTVSNVDLHNQFKRFWQLKEVRDNLNGYTLEEQSCERHFLEITFRNPQGRYVIKLPLKEDLISSLGSSRSIALNRLQGLEKRFDCDLLLRKRYTEFIDEYIALRHMGMIAEQSTDKPGIYYLPHHCVMKDTAKGSKIGVFDASCKTDIGVSLNDIMMTGPVVQEDLISILMHFRTFKYVLVADIIKMYHQIRLHSAQTRFGFSGA